MVARMGTMYFYCLPYYLQEKRLCTVHLWNVVFKLCDDQYLKFERKTINLDFELGMVNLLREEFREVELKDCRFYLGQTWSAS